jgi:hypothetical protein
VTTRVAVSASAVVLVEAYLYYRYAQLDAEFHFWLHALLGAALGLAALTGLRLASGGRRRRPSRDGAAPWASSLVGHLYSAVPDVLFMVFGVLHVLWMDVFAFHITIHFIPAPLLMMLAVFLATLAAYGLAMSHRRAPAVAALAAAAAVLVAGLALARPIPDDIQDLLVQRGLALCPVDHTSHSTEHVRATLGPDAPAL